MTRVDTYILILYGDNINSEVYRWPTKVPGTFLPAFI